MNRSTTLLFFVLAAIPALGQQFVGSVRGLVQDPGGAVIASATVTLRNEDKGTVSTTATSGAGEYSFAQVSPATYTVTVETPGFKKSEHKGVLVAAASTVSLDFAL